MKYSCPFCHHVMRYRSYHDVLDVTPIDYLIHECEKSDCMTHAHSRYRLWTYKGEIFGVDITLNFEADVYRISTRYSHDDTTLSKVAPMKKRKKDSNQYYFLKNIIQIEKAIKIDLVDPINSGLYILNRLLKLRAFS